MNGERHSLSAKFEQRCIQIGGFRLEVDGSRYYGAIHTRRVTCRNNPLAASFASLRAEHMDLHEDTIDELSDDGTIIIGGEEAGAVYYWLTIVPIAGFVVAEGSITGPEEFMRKVMNATGPKLVLQDGYVVTLQCEGGATGVLWVKALADRGPTEQCTARSCALRVLN
jgi:hypothetical protein